MSHRIRGASDAVPRRGDRPPLVARALERVDRSRLAYWDALIVEAAIASGCDALLTEDLAAGTRFDGVTVVNPFA